MHRDDGKDNYVITNSRINKQKPCQQSPNLGHNITTAANTTVARFLHVTLDLMHAEYKPYSKPDNNHSCVNTSPQQTRLSHSKSQKKDAECEKASIEAGHRTRLKCKAQNITSQ